jgi:hypothetical protein
LAFGSIVDSPEAEIATAVVRRIDVETPFSVEFARSSRTRDRAPTLVPGCAPGRHISYLLQQKRRNVITPLLAP